MATYTPDRLELDQLERQIGALKLSFARLGPEVQFHSDEDPQLIIARMDKLKKGLNTLREQCAFIHRSAFAMDRNKRKAFQGKKVTR
jgi:hypothetical protein